MVFASCSPGKNHEFCLLLFFARRLAMFHPSVGIAPVEYIIAGIGWKDRRKVAPVDFHLDEVWEAAAF